MNYFFRNLAIAFGMTLLLATSAVAQTRIATVDLRKAVESYWKKKQAFENLKEQETNESNVNFAGGALPNQAMEFDFGKNMIDETRGNIAGASSSGLTR